MNNEELLEELEAVKNCIDMTNEHIGHNKTRDDIVDILNNRIAELQETVDAKIASEEAATDQFEVA